ncbi:putative accessory protein [Shingleback nidovirus 1]|uniref:Putative accessory protein n=1 Tax=Shingleback nidovirus 1 TaxID=1912590 RepID=A0A1I9RYW1_9NIDO|nr:putative accessory protein [Shingleback nidovirus 1]AOZ57156.1 putative accessory protein [Shingleback nidovirus 1]
MNPTTISQVLLVSIGLALSSEQQTWNHTNLGPRIGDDLYWPPFLTWNKDRFYCSICYNDSGTVKFPNFNNNVPSRKWINLTYSTDGRVTYLGHHALINWRVNATHIDTYVNGSDFVWKEINQSAVLEYMPAGPYPFSVPRIYLKNTTAFNFIGKLWLFGANYLSAGSLRGANGHYLPSTSYGINASAAVYEDHFAAVNITYNLNRFKTCESTVSTPTVAEISCPTCPTFSTSLKTLLTAVTCPACTQSTCQENQQTCPETPVTKCPECGSCNITIPQPKIIKHETTEMQIVRSGEDCTDMRVFAISSTVFAVVLIAIMANYMCCRSKPKSKQQIY